MQLAYKAHDAMHPYLPPLRRINLLFCLTSCSAVTATLWPNMPVFMIILPNVTFILLVEAIYDIYEAMIDRVCGFV